MKFRSYYFQVTRRCRARSLRLLEEGAVVLCVEEPIGGYLPVIYGGRMEMVRETNLERIRSSTKTRKPKKQRVPKPRRLYMLVDEKTGQLDPSSASSDLRHVRGEGETTELAACYAFVGYRGRGKLTPPEDES